MARIAVDNDYVAPARFIAPSDSLAEAWCEFNIMWQSIRGDWDYANSQGMGMRGAAGAKKALLLGATWLADWSKANFSVEYETDTADISFLTDVGITANRWYRALLHWRHATTDSSADGVVQVWIDSTLAYSREDVQNSLLTFDQVLVGNNGNSGIVAVYNVDNLKIGAAGIAIGPESSSRIYATPMAVEPQVLKFNGQYGYRCMTRHEMTYDYCWAWDNGCLYVYAAGGAPDTYYTSIEIPSRDYGFISDGKSFWILENLDIATARKINIYLRGDQAHNNIRNCSVSAATEFNICPQSTDEISHIIVEGVESSRSGSMGITASLQSDWTIQSCTSIRDALVSSLAYRREESDNKYNWGAGIKLFGAGTGNVIQRNYVSMTALRDDSVAICAGSKGFGIWLDTCESGVVRFNRCCDAAGAGLFCEKTHNTLWHHNLSWQNQYGLRVDCDDGYSGPAVYQNAFYNNVLYANAYGIACQGGYAVAEAVATCYSNIFNNNISCSNAYRQLRARYGAENDGVYGHGNIYTHNCLGSQSTSFIEWGYNLLSTYAEWESYYGETYSVEADPQFVAP